MAQFGDLDRGSVGFPFFEQQAAADALSVGTRWPALGLGYLTICHPLRMALLRLLVLHGNLHICHKNSKTYYIFVTFANVARHVCMPAWQRALEPLQEMRTDQLTLLPLSVNSLMRGPRMSYSPCGRPGFNKQ